MITTNNIQIRQIKEIYFKKYCNKTVNLMKINRKSYYQKYFEEKRNSKAIWKGIRNIMYYKRSKSINILSSLLIKGNAITDSRDVSEHFNNFRDLLLQPKIIFQIIWRLQTQINFIFHPKQRNTWPYKYFEINKN